MPFKWTSFAIERLIELYKRQKCLYDDTSKDTEHKNQRDDAYFNIYIQIHKYFQDITIHDVKRKIRCLRLQYLRELRLMRQTSKEDIDNIRRIKLWCFFDKLSFLNTSCITIPKEILAERREISRKISTSNNDKESSKDIADMHNFMEISYEEFSNDLTQSESDYDSKANNDIVDIPDPILTNHNDETLASTSPLPIDDTRNCLNQLQHEGIVIKNPAHASRIDVKERRKYEWLGMLVTSQMDEINTEDQPYAAWEIQVIVQKYIEMSLKKKQNQ